MVNIGYEERLFENSLFEYRRKGGRIMKRLTMVAVGVILLAAGPAGAAQVTVAMNAVGAGGVGDLLGTIAFLDMPGGLRSEPNLSGLGEGRHGFHVHQNPDCGTKEKDGKTVAGLAAGGHFDPTSTGRHEGPAGNGHLGDLPVLYVDHKGRANRVSVAARLKTSDLAGRSIMIHAGGDNHSDQPARLGGGGARVACGVVVY